MLSGWTAAVPEARLSILLVPPQARVTSISLRRFIVGLQQVIMDIYKKRLEVVMVCSQTDRQPLGRQAGWPLANWFFHVRSNFLEKKK